MSPIVIYIFIFYLRNKDARWFTRQEVSSVLDPDRRPQQAPSTSVDEGTPDKSADEPPFKVPPAMTIAGVLIRDWIAGKLVFQAETALKGNL